MDQQEPGIEEGELFAYLEGQRLPRVVLALERSAKLRERLQQLQQADQQFRRLFGGVGIPEAQDLVDVVSGQATPRQQQRVARYVRATRAGQEELAMLRKNSQPKPAQAALPHFLLLPQVPSFGIRGDSDVGRAFSALELQAQVTIEVSLSGELWRVEGRVTQQHTPVQSAQVSLQSPAYHPRARKTDQEGFFVFQKVPVGVYRLEVMIPEQGVLELPTLHLNAEL